jgi:hypothetical protein
VGEKRVRYGPWVDVTYYEADAEFVQTLSAEFNALPGSACAAWACPSNLHLSLQLTELLDPSILSTLPKGRPASVGQEPLLFEMLLTTPFRSFDTTLSVYAPPMPPPLNCSSV